MTFSAHLPQLAAAIARSSCAVVGCVLQAECEVVVSVFFNRGKIKGVWWLEDVIGELLMGTNYHQQLKGRYCTDYHMRLNP